MNMNEYYCCVALRCMTLDRYNHLWNHLPPTPSLLPERPAAWNSSHSNSATIAGRGGVVVGVVPTIDFGGAFNAPKTSAHTPNIPAPPIAYATSRPAHQ